MLTPASAVIMRTAKMTAMVRTLKTVAASGKTTVMAVAVKAASVKAMAVLEAAASKVVASAEAGAEAAGEAEIEAVMAMILEAAAALATSGAVAAAKPAAWVISACSSARPGASVLTGTALVVSACLLLLVLLEGPSVVLVGQVAMVVSEDPVACVTLANPED